MFALEIVVVVVASVGFCLFTAAWSVGLLRASGHRHRVERLEEWHERHTNEMLVSGDPGTAVMQADRLTGTGTGTGVQRELAERDEAAIAALERELSERDLEVEAAGNAVRSALERIHTLDEQVERLKKMQPPDGHIKVMIPLETIEVQSLGSPSFPVTSRYAEVLLGPSDLRVAAFAKYRQEQIAEAIQRQTMAASPLITIRPPQGWGTEPE
jgi:hypothetical protein